MATTTVTSDPLLSNPCDYGSLLQLLQNPLDFSEFIFTCKAISKPWDIHGVHGYDTREKVGVIVFDKDGFMLIVEKNRKFSLPKGGRMSYETEYTGALREAWEETGLDLTGCVYTRIEKLIWGTYFVYHLDVRGIDIPLTPQQEEIDKIYWRKTNSEWIRKKANLNSDLRELIKRLNESPRATTCGESPRATTCD